MSDSTGTEAQVGRQTGSTSDSHRVQRPPEGHADWTIQLLPTRWWRWGLPRASPSRRCARYSKKRTQAVEEEGVVHPGGERGVRGSNGGRAGPVPRRLRPGPSRGLFDETSRQLVADKRPVIGAKPGRVERYDYEYSETAPKPVQSVSRKLACRGDRAAYCCGLRSSDGWLMMHTLHRDDTVGAGQPQHSQAGLVVRCSSSRSRRIAKRLEFHYTPLHGSWLNMAEIELSVLAVSQPSNRDEVTEARLERKRNEAVAVKTGASPLRRSY